MLNRVVLVGRLTKDPELRYTPQGTAVANFTLAVNRTFKNANGENEADFIQIQTWKKVAENTANFCKKGSLVGIDGRLQTRNFEGQDGRRVYVTEVVAESVQFLEPKGNGSQQQQYNNSNSQNSSNNNNYGAQNNRSNSNNNGPKYYHNDPFRDSGQPIDIDDSDLPF